MTEANNECKSMPCSNFLKMRGTDKFYQEALEAASKFNRRLVMDRKTRIPFIDSQTRVAQTNSLLWYVDYQREKGAKSDQVYSYPLKSWVKKRRLHYENDINIIRLPSYEAQQQQQQQQQQINENSNSTDSIQPVYKYPGIEQDDQATRALIDDWHMQEDSFDYYNDNDNDNESDYDDYEENKRKKKKGGKGTGKKRSEIGPEDKPFVCDKCGVKYKTKPGLTYHVQKMHSLNNSNNNHTSANSHSGVHASHSNHAQHAGHHTDTNAESAVIRQHSNSAKAGDYDENTNSVFDSQFDDSNHTQPNPPPQAAAAGIIKYPPAPPTKICLTCGFASVDQDPKRQLDKLVSCSECSRSFHPVCLNFTQNMIVSVKKYNWQCIECKKCTICGNSENDDKLLFCDDCDRGYHMYCLNPPLNDAPEGDWRCTLCVQQFGTQ